MTNQADVSRPFALDFGASTLLSQDRVALQLNQDMRDFDRIYIHAIHCRNGSSGAIRFRISNGGSWRPLGSIVAGPVTRNYPQDALYLVVPAAATSQTAEYGVAVTWIHQPAGHSQGTSQMLEIEVTDWNGGSITYSDLQLIGVATKHNLERRAYGVDNRIITGANELRGRTE